MNIGKAHLVALLGLASLVSANTPTSAAGLTQARAAAPAVITQARPGPYCTRVRCFPSYTACMASTTGPCRPQGRGSPRLGMTEWRNGGGDQYVTLSNCLNSRPDVTCYSLTGTIVVPPEYSVDPSGPQRKGSLDVEPAAMAKWICIQTDNGIKNGKCVGPNGDAVNAHLKIDGSQ